MKATQAFQSLCKSLGIKLTDAQNAELEKAKDIDLPDDIDPVIDFMANDGAKQVKGAMRKEAFDATDKVLKEVIESIDDEELKTELQEVIKKDGVPTKIREYATKVYAKTKAYKEAKGEGNTEDAKKLKLEIDKLNTKISEYASKETEYESTKKKADKADRLEKQVIENEIATRALTHAGISDDRKKDRFFRKNFLGDVSENLEKKNLYIHPETLQILQKDTDQPFQFKGSEFTMDTLLNEVAEHEDWKKKSNTTTKGKLPITQDGEVDEATLAAAANLMD